jgi:hypothetical protein
MSLSIRSTSSSPRRGQRLRAPRRSSLAVVKCLLENRCRNPRRRRKIFCSSANGARVEEQGEDVAGEWVDLCGKALLGQNSRLMREAEEKERKTKVSEVAKRLERRKKSNGAPACPRIRDNQQREEGKQRALGREKAAATRLE